MLKTLQAIALVMVIKLILKTLRVRYIGDQIDSTGIVGFLHGEQLPLLLNRPKLPLIAPISLSADGELQVEVMKRFSIEAVRGSTSRGGLSVLRGLVRWLNENKGVALIAVDGPRGPYAKLSPGASYLATRLKLPIWICRVQCSRSIVLNTWDRFIIPLPFSLVEIYTYRCAPTIEAMSSKLCSEQLK